MRVIEQITTKDGKISLEDWSTEDGTIQITAHPKAAVSFGYHTTKGKPFHLTICPHDGYTDKDIKNDFESLRSGAKRLTDLSDHFYYRKWDAYCLTGKKENTGLSKRQEMEVSGAMANGITYEQLARYADPKYTYQQMYELYSGFFEDLTDEQVKIYDDPKLPAWLMEEAKIGLTDMDFTDEEVSLYAKPGFTQEQIAEIEEGLGSLTLKEVSVYAKPEISAEEMEKIREQMEEGTFLGMRNDRDVPFGDYDGISHEELINNSKLAFQNAVNIANIAVERGLVREEKKLSVNEKLDKLEAGRKEKTAVEKDDKVK